jgi:hypothetical protein
MSSPLRSRRGGPLAVLILQTLILLGLVQAGYLPEPIAGTFEFGGHLDSAQRIQLRSQFDIPDDGELELPIEVQSKSQVAVSADAPPKIWRVTTEHADGTFGAGEEILIDVHFTSEVVVEGSPTMTMTTGCHDDSCYTKEVQSIVCKADFGHFALGFDGNWVTNIDVLADQEVVKKKLEELEGIESVTVSYGLADDRDYSDGRRACTSIGNMITVTFDKHSYRGGHGDLPELQLDILNDPLNQRIFLGVGDGEFLLGRLADSTIGTTPDTGIFTEVVKGLEYEDLSRRSMLIRLWTFSWATETIRTARWLCPSCIP